MSYAIARDPGNVAEINIIPLADVLLVLLIIFMVTAPVATRTMGLDISRGTDKPLPLPKEVALRIDAAGDVYRDGALVPLAQLEQDLRALAAQAEQAPKVSIDASDQVDYDSVAQVLAATSRAGLQQVTFARH